MSDWFRPVPLFEGEDEAALKAEFARLWAKYPNSTPAEIGYQVFADLFEPMRGYQAGAVWSRELAVQEMRDEYALTGGDPSMIDLPSKEEAAKEVVALARTARDPKDRLAAYRLYGEITGIIEKPGVTVNNNVQVNRVMKVAIHGTEAEWEQKLQAQQSALMANATSSTH